MPDETEQTFSTNTKLTLSVVLILATIIGTAVGVQMQARANTNAICEVQAAMDDMPDAYVPRREYDARLVVMSEDIKDIKSDLKSLLTTQRATAAHEE